MMLILRIKQAQTALADGRLDEAYRLVQPKDIQQHKRGQILIGKLAKALAKRSKLHLDAGRISQALNDCNKAEKLAGNNPNIAQLRAKLCEIITQNRKDLQNQNQKLEAARHSLEAGWLSVGEKILNDTDADDNRADLLLNRAAAIRVQMDAVVASAQQALNRGDIEAAINVIKVSRLTNSRNSRIDGLIAKIKSQAEQKVVDYLNNGRTDLAYSILQHLRKLSPDSARVKELSTAISELAKASFLVKKGQSQSAAQILRKVKLILPVARWLDTAIEKAQNAAESLNYLLTGPLALIELEQAKTSSGGSLYEENNTERSQMSDDLVSQSAGKLLPGEFVLQADGVGSYFVFTKPIVTIGPVSSPVRPDLALMADSSLPVVTVERIDEDYFLRAQKAVFVNDKQTDEKLLVDGDSIALSNRCRIKFHLPNAASTTATIIITGARLARPDVKSIILMDRDILVGRDLNNHIRAEQIGEKMTFLAKDRRLLCRTNEQIYVNGRHHDSEEPLAFDVPVKVGNLSLVLTQLKG